MAGASSEGEEDEAIEIGRSTVMGGEEKAGDFVFCEDSISTGVFFEFDEAKGGIFTYPVEVLGGIGEEAREGSDVAVDGGGGSFGSFISWSIDEELSFLAEEFGSDVDEVVVA